MGVQLRAILTAAAGFTAILLVIWGVDHGIVQPAFVELERTQALEDGMRARAVIQGELRQLDQKLGDWAEWDDAYAFAANPDPAFIQSNLGDWGVLENSTHLNLCVILDRQGRRLYSGGYDSDLGGAVLPAAFAGDPPAIWAALQPGLEQEQARAGLLLTEHGLLLLAARPILTTQGLGPARGLLAFGRFLDEPLRRTLAEQTQVAFELLPAADSRLTADEQTFWRTLPADKPVLRPGPGGALFVYEMLPDLAGTPIALLRTPIRQDISRTAQHTSRTLVGALGLAALALLLGGACWSNRLRQSGTGATTVAWGAATLAVLIGLTLTAGLGWEFQRQGLFASGDFSIQLAGGVITLLLALYLFTLVSQRQRAEAQVAVRTAELQASEERYRTVALLTGQMIYDYDCPTGRIQWAGAIATLTGQDAAAFAAVDIDAWAALIHPEDRPPALDRLRQAMAADAPYVVEYRFQRGDGAYRWIEDRGAFLLDEHGTARRMLGAMKDVTDRRRAEARQRLAAAVFEAARDAILVTNADGKIIAVNPAFTALTGYAEAEVRGRSPRLLWAERQPEAYFEAMWQTVSHEGIWQGEFWVRRRDGERRAALASLGAVRNETDRITHYVGIATDITTQKATEQRIERLAYYDALTALPNRALLTQRAELALALAARHGEALAVLFLDLDRFKEVNDSLGHAEGDALLMQVADRLQTLTRAEDTVCRLGGDEFVLLLPEAGQEGALRVADKVLAAFQQPFAVAGHCLGVTVSIGIALYPYDGADFAELLKNADTALYRAKHEGRNTRVFYDRAMNAATLARLVLEGELRQAIENQQLRAYFQPKVRLADGALVGAEALVRWRHPERGLVSPGQFIPVAEASDLIVDLGNWMLGEVCRQLAAWQRQGGPPLTVAINLAARHFRQPGLADRLRDLLKAHGLPAQVLELELTESTLLDAGADIAANLAQLERLGVGLALDDFGTGYSSLSYLKRLPLTTLKIDRSFVRDLATDSDDRILAATIIALGHQMELKVVAEGVETEEQRQILLEQGCDLAQGYLFDRPMPPEAFATAWLTPACERPA